MSETTFRLARLGEDAAIIDFINDNFDMRLPLLNRPELYHHYYAGRGGVPQFAVAVSFLATSTDLVWRTFSSQ